MKIASLLVPAYLPRSYIGATPTPYQSGTVDNFERELAALSPFVVRQPNATRLLTDPAGRFVAQQIVTQYDLLFDPETTNLGEAIMLALKSFTLDTITVVCDGDAEPFKKDDAENIAAGLHAWNDAP